MRETHGPPTLPNHPAFVPPPRRHPVAAFFGILFALGVLAGGSYAVYVWEHQKVTDLQASVQSLRSQLADLQQRVVAVIAAQSDSSSNKSLARPVGLALNNGTVITSLPAGWTKATAAGLNTVCSSPGTGRTACEDVATIVPSSLNKDDGGFLVAVRVFQNAGNEPAKDWFLSDYGGSLPLASEDDQTSVQPIDSASAYYFLQNVMPTYEDVYYVVAAHGQSVVVYARMYRQSQSGNIPAQDFRQYLPAIQAFANSIRFED